MSGWSKSTAPRGLRQAGTRGPPACSFSPTADTCGSPSPRRNATGVQERERWRALLLLVKAKLVAVDGKIATFEEAFVGDIVLPETGKTVWESVREPLQLAYAQNKAVPLLPGG